MNACPCCSSPMLQHFRHHRAYWFCRSCWQEMPTINLSADSTTLSLSMDLADLLAQRRRAQLI